MTDENKDQPIQETASPSGSVRKSEAASADGKLNTPFQHIKKKASGIVIAAVLIILLVFVLQNLNTVHVRFFWMEGRVFLSLALLFSFALGIVTTWLVLRFGDKIKHLKSSK